MTKRHLQFPKPHKIVNWEQYETCIQASNLIWRLKWVTGVRRGNSLVVRRVSPGGIIVVLFRAKCAVPRQIKPRIPKLTIRRGKNNLSIAFISVSREKGHYRVVSVEQPRLPLALVLRAQPPYARRPSIQDLFRCIKAESGS